MTKLNLGPYRAGDAPGPASVPVSVVVLTRDEISGLTSGLLVSHDPPLGELTFSDWLDEHADEIGRRYANELERHFAVA